MPPTDLNDDLLGTSGADVIASLAGADTVSGGDGADTISGGDGHDILNGGAGNDVIYGHSVADIDPASGRINVVKVGEGIPGALFGTFAPGDPGFLYVVSKNGDIIRLDLATGNDIMFGGTGSDSYGVDSSGDAIGENVGEGFDAVYSTASYTLGANLEQLNLLGSALEGYGNGLANAIFGNALNNILNGGTGDDVLNGGAGNDTFLFLPGTGRDVISDFVAGGTDDRVDLTAYAGTGITYTLTQTGADAVFNFSNGDQIVLVGVNSASLVQSGDFWL